MIKEILMYTICCDNCGVDSNEGEDISAYQDSSDVIENLVYWGWLIDRNKHYCFDCCTHDANGNLVLKESDLTKGGIENE